MIKRKLILSLTAICISLFIGCGNDPFSPSVEVAADSGVRNEPSHVERAANYEAPLKSPLPSESRYSDIRSGFNNRNGLYDGDSLHTIIHP
ncbi:MAG: hypothetical protein ACE5DN_04770 [Flavobacteriales bacterium]